MHETVSSQTSGLVKPEHLGVSSARSSQCASVAPSSDTGAGPAATPSVPGTSSPPQRRRLPVPASTLARCSYVRRSPHGMMYTSREFNGEEHAKPQQKASSESLRPAPAGVVRSAGPSHSQKQPTPRASRGGPGRHRYLATDAHYAPRQQGCSAVGRRPRQHADLSPAQAGVHRPTTAEYRPRASRPCALLPHPAHPRRSVADGAESLTKPSQTITAGHRRRRIPNLTTANRHFSSESRTDSHPMSRQVPLNEQWIRSDSSTASRHLNEKVRGQQRETQHVELNAPDTPDDPHPRPGRPAHPPLRRPGRAPVDGARLS